MATGDFDLTHRLLSKFYPFLSPLVELLPRETARENDTEAFHALLRGTMVASSAELTLRVEPDLSQHRSPMKEVSPRRTPHLSTTSIQSKHGQNRFVDDLLQLAPDYRTVPETTLPGSQRLETQGQTGRLL